MTKRSTQSPRAPKGKKKSTGGKPTGTALTAALKSFEGHLEGSGKALHTIAAYRFDLQNFAEFLRGTRGGKGTVDLRHIVRKDLERYHDWLKQNGQKTNTRRRKLMTVRKLMHYLTGRKKLDLDIAKRLPAPEKLERVPEVIELVRFRNQVASLDSGSPISLRNVALLLFLADTGASVSEAAKLRWSQLDQKSGEVTFFGKGERTLKLSGDALASLARLREQANENELIFIGFNRHGPLRIGKKGIGITPRGIEILVKTIATGLDYPRVTPRTLRHSAVVEWYRAGVTETEIQRRLGLRTAYAFRIYAPIFAAIKSSSRTTSTA